MTVQRKSEQQQQKWVLTKPISVNPLPWTHTKISAALRCPLEFYLSCLNLRKGIAPKPQRTGDGIYLHQLAHALLTEGDVTLEMPDDYTIPKEYFDSLGKFFKEHLPTLKEQVGDPHTIEAEVRIRLDSKLQPQTEYLSSYITGVIDLLLYNPDTQTAILIDYKSGKNAKEDWSQKKTERQLLLYTLLVHKGIAPVQKVGRILYPLYDGELVWLTDGIVDFKEEETRDYVRDLILEAQKCFEKIEPRLNPMCPFCDYRNLCPIYEDGDADVR